MLIRLWNDTGREKILGPYDYCFFKRASILDQDGKEIASLAPYNGRPCWYADGDPKGYENLMLWSPEEARVC